MQDKTLQVQRQPEPVSTVAFSLGNNGVDPATYATLETPSGQPFYAVPKQWQARLVGGMWVFATPVKGACKEMVFFILGCRAGGEDVNASLSASYVPLFLEEYS